MFRTITHAVLAILASVLIFLLACGKVRAQAPLWQTAVAVSGDESSISATATDAVGNVYVAGNFRGVVRFGNTVLTSAGDADIFVAKWLPSTGTFAWAQRAGGPGSDYAPTVAVSGTSVYVAGQFAVTATFGNLSLTSTGTAEGFVAKLIDTESSASFVWAQRFGGSGSDDATALAVSGSTVYLAGRFYSTSAGFGTLSLTNASTNGSSGDGFVAKLIDAGSTANFVWVQPVASSGDDYVSAIAATGSTVYVTGGFSNTVTFGSTSLMGGALSAFVAKITDGGASAGFTWAIQNSGGVVIPNAIAVNGTNVYVVGRFLFTLVLGTTTFTSTGISGGYDVFVTKITDAGLSGSFTWALQGAGPRSDYAAAVAVNGSAVYVAGGFSGTVGFGSADLTSVAGSDDVFITQLLDAGSSGRFTWAQSAGGTDYEQARSVAIGPGNKVYVGGNVVPVATFGNLAITNSSTNPVGFLASLTDAVLSTNASTALVGLQVYPNPATTATTVLLPTAVGATHTTLTLTDALGRVVRHLSPTFYPANERGLRQKIDVGGLPAGIYTLRVQIGSTCTARQLVITD